jgi:hypothetical protein
LLYKFDGSWLIPANRFQGRLARVALPFFELRFLHWHHPVQLRLILQGIREKQAVEEMTHKIVPANGLKLPPLN